MRRSRRARRAPQEKSRYQAAHGWPAAIEAEEQGPSPAADPEDTPQLDRAEAGVDVESPASAGVPVGASETGQGPPALAKLNQSLTQRPDDVGLLVARGALLVTRQEWDQALDDLRRAVRLAPDAWRAWDELGFLYWRRGRPTEAAECYRRVAAARPSARALLHLGKALLQAGDLSGAQAALERSAEMDPRSAETYRLLGGVADRYGRSEEASAYYQRALEWMPE